jgi:hypothetical protein
MTNGNYEEKAIGLELLLMRAFHARTGHVLASKGKRDLEMVLYIYIYCMSAKGRERGWFYSWA